MSEIRAEGVNGQITFDGTFVTIHRKGLMARAGHGKGEKRIPLSSISAVQWKPPGKMTRGFIQFTVPGGNEVRSKRGEEMKDAAKDENSVVVGISQKEEFEVLRAAVDTAIMEREMRGSSPAAAAASSSTADELKKLAELRDAGVLSAEEFDAQKTRLLS